MSDTVEFRAAIEAAVIAFADEDADREETLAAEYYAAHMWPAFRGVDPL